MAVILWTGDNLFKPLPTHMFIDKGFSLFYLFRPGNCEHNATSRPRSIPSRFFQIHYVVAILRFLIAQSV
jgi:hypothetical protein